MAVVLSLKSRAKFPLPHRQMDQGEALCSISFKSQADADFFRGQLRWSAFSVEAEAADPGDEPAKRGPGRPPKPKTDAVSP